MSENGRNLSLSDEQTLQRYHDGELNPVSRWLFGRRLGRSPQLQAQLDELREVGAWMRQADTGGPTVDLWDKIALSLPAADAQRAEDEQHPLTESFGWSLVSRHRPLFAAAATAVVAVALVLGTIGDAPAPNSGVVRWLDTGGRSVIVLDEFDDATIVWLLEPPIEGVSTGGLREAV